MKIVISPAVGEDRLERIVSAVHGEVVNAADENEARGAIADSDAFFGKMTPELLAAARNLRWIQCPTASLEHYVFPELVDHPSTLTNMRGIYSDVIADQVIGYILCFARNLHLYVRRQIEARWSPVGSTSTSSHISFTTGPGVPDPAQEATLHLPDQTLGIVGFGGIGRAVAERAAVFGMSLLAVDAQPSATTAGDLPSGLEEVWLVDRLGEMLARADFICIAAPHTPDTFKLFRRSQFERMKSTAYVINIGRGVIVDLADLTAALEAKEIAGAALDVFEVEPLPEDHPLWRMHNVIITPHVAGESRKVPERHLGVLLDNVELFQKDQPLHNVVDKKKWY